MSTIVEDACRGQITSVMETIAQKENLSAEFAGGERSFGNSWRGELDFEFSRGSTTLGYSESPTSTAFNQSEQTSRTLDPDDLGEFLDTPGEAETYLLKQLSWILTIDLRRLGISVSAFDKNAFSKICRPKSNSSWEKLKETLELLPSFKCPTVIRFTLAKHMNLEYPKQFAKLVQKANPTYLEPKAYMHVGFSRLRMEGSNMPLHHEIKDFAIKMSEAMGYNIIDESPASRVVLLSHLEKPIKLA